jgi:hypothetical protein
MSMTSRVRVAGACLVGFAVTFFANMVLTDVPDIGATNAAATAFYATAANRRQAVVAFYVLVAVVICLVAVLAALLPLARARGRDGLASAAWASGGAFIGLYLAGGAAFLLPTATVTLGFGDSATIDPVFARTVSTWGDAFFLIAAPVALGGCIALTCRAAHISGAMPGWIAYSGYAVAVSLVLAGWAWFPLPVMAIWALIAGLRSLLGRDRISTAHAADADIDHAVISPA